VVGRFLTPLLLATAGLFTSTGRAAAAGDVDRVFVTAQPRDRADVDRIWRLSDHVLGPHDPQPVPHTLIVRREAVERLRAMGVPLTVRPIDVPALLADMQRAARASVRPSQAAPISVGQLGIFGGWFSRVQDLAAIYAHLDELAGASNGRARVIVIGTSVEGREIRGLQIDARDPGRASILITGTQHAREWAAPMVTMGFANALVRQYAFDRDVRTIASTVGITIVPVVNVDGYVASHNGQRLQRKNMNPRCGVDLNRNFDVQFGAGMPAACDQENYPGAGPFSEPESRAMRQLAGSLPNLRLFLDYHAPSEQVMVPYAYTRTRPPDYERSLARAQLYATTLSKLYGTLHPAREGYDLAQGQGGGAIDWFRLNHCESFAIELRDGRELAGFELPAAQIIPAVEENWLAWRALALQIAHDNGAPTGEMGDPGPTLPAGSAPDESPRAAGCAVDPAAPASPSSWLATLPLLALALSISRLRPRRLAPGARPRVRARGTRCGDRCPGVLPPSSCCPRLPPG
jgi:hypothetical protein